MISVGIDVGSTTTKVVFLEDKKILAKDICATGPNPKLTVNEILEKIFAKTGLSFKDLNYIVSTGYGRRIVDFAHKTITEISACSRGIKFSSSLNPRTIIDLGGQDTKVISVNETGEIEDFVMNDKCAAGTGKFLEVIANRLGLKVDQLSEVSEKAQENIIINSTCTVFVETEIVSLIAQNKRIEDIVKGIHLSIAERIVSMLKKVIDREPIFFCGGGAKNKALHKIIEEKLNKKIYLPEIDCQFVIAFGAGLL